MSQQNSNNNGGYCVVPNSVLRNNKLSAEARFLWIFCSSLPPDWRFNIKGLAFTANITEHMARKALAELEREGLLQRTRERNNGKLGEAKYMLLPCVESPHVVSPHVESPHVVSPHVVSPHVESPRVVDLTLLNKDRLNTDIPSKDQQSVYAPCVEIPHAVKPRTEKKHQYAENVTMTESEHQALVDKLGSEQAANACIEILDNYKGSSGRKYKSDYRAILSWVVGEYEKRQAKKPQRFNDVASAAARVAEMIGNE